MTIQISNQKNLLVIDDEIDILIPLKDYLESEGYNVSTAMNGLEAMEILKNGSIPNLILLDMKMPIMDGWKFAAEFLDKYNHMSPIIVMTAAADAKKRANDIQAAGWIEKPFDLDVLIEKVKKFEKK